MTKPRNLPGIKIAYNSSLIYPGVSTGAEFLLKTSGYTNLKKTLTNRTGTKNQLISFNLNWYHHRGFHDNIYLTSEWNYRKIRSGGLFTEFSAGAGYSRTFLGGTTYTVADDGTVGIKKHAGYNYALLTTGWGIGYDFYNIKKSPWQAFAKINVIAMFPYNNVLYFRPVMEAGARFSVNHCREIRKSSKYNIILK